MKSPIAIMQGRLSPPRPDRLQCFPWKTWEREFEYAAALGLDAIEWLFEADDFKRNPVWTPAGRTAIRRRAAETGVRTVSLCADYFMSHPFFRISVTERLRSVDMICRLVDAAREVGVQSLLLPVLEVSEVRTPAERGLLLESLQHPLALALTAGLRIGLETELPVADYSALVRDAAHPALGVYYDTGNAAACGYDTAADIVSLSPLLCGVHLKDRPVGGSSVPLGQGAARFDRFFAALRPLGYEGVFTLQTTSGADFLGDARRHVQFVKEHWQ